MSYPEALPIGPATCTYPAGGDVWQWPTEILAVHPREWRTYGGFIEQDGWVYTIWSRDKSRTMRLGHEWVSPVLP